MELPIPTSSLRISIDIFSWYFWWFGVSKHIEILYLWPFQNIISNGFSLDIGWSFLFARRQNVHLKPEKDAADEVDFKGMEITQSWTGKGSLDMTDESQLNQVRVHLEWFVSTKLSTQNSSLANLGPLDHVSGALNTKVLFFFLLVRFEFPMNTVKLPSEMAVFPTNPTHPRHTSTIGTSRGLHCIPVVSSPWPQLNRSPLAIPKAIPLNAQADFRTAGFRCLIFCLESVETPKISRDRKVASMDTSDTDDVYWKKDVPKK